MKTTCSFLCFIIFAISLFAQNSPEQVMKDFLEKHHPHSGLSTTSPIKNNTRELSWRSADDRLDSLYQWIWDTDAGEWQVLSKTYYAIDEAGNFISEELWTWDGIQWSKSTRETFTYDVNNNPVHDLTQTWNGTDWQMKNNSSTLSMPTWTWLM